MLADLTPRAAAGELTRDEVAAALAALLDPATPDGTRAAFLRAWSRRGETAAELAACAEALLPRAVAPPVRGSWKGRPLLDCCGTGGGGLNLINISTGIVFILAAMGVPVVKHGNRGLTKKSGSADVLEALGIRIDLPPERMEACLEEVGAAFLFAPAYHTSFSVLAPVRKQLGAEGQRTVFNLLGPLLNPARPDARLVGVFSREHGELYREALERLRCPRFIVACGWVGPEKVNIGEVTTNETTEFWHDSSVSRNNRPRLTLVPQVAVSLDKLRVANASESAGRLQAIFSSLETGFAHDLLVVNAAVAAWTQGTVSSFEEGESRAREAVASGLAQKTLRRWQEFSVKA
jgi:anthranilate phosphoribosyltransferase